MFCLDGTQDEQLQCADTMTSFHFISFPCKTTTHGVWLSTLQGTKNEYSKLNKNK